MSTSHTISKTVRPHKRLVDRSKIVNVTGLHFQSKVSKNSCTCFACNTTIYDNNWALQASYYVDGVMHREMIHDDVTCVNRLKSYLGLPYNTFYASREVN